MQFLVHLRLRTFEPKRELQTYLWTRMSSLMHSTHTGHIRANPVPYIIQSGIAPYRGAQLPSRTSIVRPLIGPDTLQTRPSIKPQKLLHGSRPPPPPRPHAARVYVISISHVCILLSRDLTKFSPFTSALAAKSLQLRCPSSPPRRKDSGNPFLGASTIRCHHDIRQAKCLFEHRRDTNRSIKRPEHTNTALANGH